jgi:hypothetical protein
MTYEVVNQRLIWKGSRTIMAAESIQELIQHPFCGVVNATPHSFETIKSLQELLAILHLRLNLVNH